MTVCQGVVHARDLHAGRLRESQPFALVLLGVRKARVDGKDQGGVARESRVVRTAIRHGTRHLRKREQEPLTAGIPQALVHVACKTRGLEARPVLYQPVAREEEVVLVRTRGPRLHAGIGLCHGLGLEGATRARVRQLIDSGIDLAPHGVHGHREKPAHASHPGLPGRRIEGRHAVEGAGQPAGEALGRGHAYAHARKGAGTAAHQHLVHVGHGQVGVRQRLLAGTHKLDVGAAPAHVVARGEKLDGLLGIRAHAPDGAGQHVGGGVEGKDDPGGGGANRRRLALGHGASLAIRQPRTPRPAVGNTTAPQCSAWRET